MISVRISEEEYLALRRICSMTGARSVSDLTRDAMRTLLSGGNRVDGIGSSMDEFRTEIRKLGISIEQLATKVATSKTDSDH